MRKALMGLTLVFLSTVLMAEDSELPVETSKVHWALSSFLGTGWYKVDDSRSVFAIQILPRQIMRESWFNSRVDRQIGIEIKYDTTIGLFSLDDFPTVHVEEEFGTIAFTPGVELEIPVTRDFYLRPFAQLGWGTEFGSSSSAWIWFGGIKSRYRFPGSQNKLGIIGNIYYGGFNASDAERDDLSGIALGLEGAIPLGGWSIGGDVMELDWHAMYTQFGNEPLFSVSDNEAIPLEQMFELGLGLAVKWDPDSDFLALTINFTSWFRR